MKESESLQANLDYLCSDSEVISHLISEITQITQSASWYNICHPFKYA